MSRAIGTTSQPLRYGENAYQKAYLVASPRPDDPLSITRFDMVGGATPSATNLTDLDRALATMTFARAALSINAPGKPHCVALGVKHGNCCGAAHSTSPLTAIQKMLEGDLEAIFGGVIMLNIPVDEHVAHVLLNWEAPTGRKRLIDVLVAPQITPEARKLLERKDGRCKMFVNPALLRFGLMYLDPSQRERQIRGAKIVQDPYSFVLDFRSRKIRRIGTARPERKLDLAFAAAICATSTSNTVTLVRDGMLIGNGVGQTKRSRAAWLAVEIAKQNEHETRGAVACSDSFFPFTDGPKLLIKAGVSAIFATSGSVNDKQVQSTCRDAGVTLYHLPDKEARMFYGH